jgi:hypothetical protein
MKRTTHTNTSPSTTKQQPRVLDATELTHITGGNEVMKKRNEMSM